MTDLEIIIKELEERIKMVKRAAEKGKGEPDGIYAYKDLQILQNELRLFQYFHPEYKEIADKEIEKQKKEVGQILLRNALFKKLQWLSEKTLSLEEYERELTKIIKSHMRHLQAQKKVIPQEIEAKDLGKDSPLLSVQRQDKVYELTEALYDGLLDRFEVRIPSRRRESASFVVERRDNLILITLHPQYHREKLSDLKSKQNIKLRDIGYRRSEGYWQCLFDERTATFDNLITVIARTLIEVYHTVNKTIEVVYQEYES